MTSMRVRVNSNMWLLISIKTELSAIRELWFKYNNLLILACESTGPKQWVNKRVGTDQFLAIFAPVAHPAEWLVTGRFVKHITFDQGREIQVQRHKLFRVTWVRNPVNFTLAVCNHKHKPFKSIVPSLRNVINKKLRTCARLCARICACFNIGFCSHTKEVLMPSDGMIEA